MFSQVCIIPSVHGGYGKRGAYVAKEGECVAKGGMAGEMMWGHAWQGTGGGGMCSRGHAWWVRHACVAGEMVTAVHSTHPTRMHSCCLIIFIQGLSVFIF